MQYLAALLISICICFPAAAADYCADNPEVCSVVSCVNGETGVCRSPVDLTLANVTLTITNSASAADDTTLVDGVYLMAGTGDWTSAALTVANKRGLTIYGTGSGPGGTQINCDSSKTCLTISGATSHLRIKGIYFKDIVGGGSILRAGITNLIVTSNRFTHDVQNSANISIWATSAGVVAGNVFDGAYYKVIYVSNPFTSVDTSIDYSVSTWLFFEGNTVNCTTCSDPETTETAEGGKLVVRYNTFTETVSADMGTIFDAHNVTAPIGGNGSVNARGVQFYNNRIAYNSANTGDKRAFYIRGGTGLIYNNDVSSSNVEIGTYFNLKNYRAGGGEVWESGGCATDANNASAEMSGTRLARCCSTAYHPNEAGVYPEGEGYPCVGQPGFQGNFGGEHEPIYFWNNRKSTNGGNTWSTLTSTSVSIAATESWSMAEDRDWCVGSSRQESCGGHTLNFSAYSCPHPLSGFAGSCGGTAGTTGYNMTSTFTLGGTGSLTLGGSGSITF
jgi:hypothetical protein